MTKHLRFLFLAGLSTHVGPATLKCQTSRCLSTDVNELDSFITRMKGLRIVEEDTIDIFRVRQLYVTLPTRDGTFKYSKSSLPLSFPKPTEPRLGDLFGLGHSLILFPPLVPLKHLGPDGTDPTYNSPPPYTRRMWAGGEFSFHDPWGHLGLRIGDTVKSVTTVPSVDVKKEGSMVFVNQLRKLSTKRGLAVTEKRTHVFLPPPRVVSDPDQVLKPFDATANASTCDARNPDVSFTFIPTAAMLFRFSALTFNSHMIHLDPEFSRKVDGHGERLVHGPLTSLLLLELASLLTPPGAKEPPTVKCFSYQARHPVLVGKALTLCGTYVWQEGDDNSMPTGTRLWAENDQGIVCMTADAEFIGTD